MRSLSCRTSKTALMNSNPAQLWRQTSKGSLVERVDDLGGLRELRLVGSTANLPSILWVLLLGAGQLSQALPTPLG